METILVPTDFSEAADNAVNYAVGLAKYFDAKILLLNAFSAPYVMYEPAFQPDLIPVFYEASKERLGEIKERIHKMTANRIKVECISDCNSAFDAIASVTDRGQEGRVLQTHAASPLRRGDEPGPELEAS